MTALASLLGGAGCAGNVAEAAFATDFECDSGVTSEEGEAAGRVRVTGCGHTATYQCISNLCVIQTSDLDGRGSSPDGGDRSDRAAASSKPIKPEVRLENKGDEAVLVLELVLERALLRITATPEKRADVVQFKLVRNLSSTEADQCNLDWMLNGQPIATPKWAKRCTPWAHQWGSS